ncbi:MAG: TIGR03032 family protein [Leptolyngbyaceae bacterium]|nr:TIGR03032 family protein [Leptolyngbyaceae bacterium]
MAALHPQDIPLRSVHTSNFADILAQLGISLVVSTYQAGKLITLRADNGVINTHFRVFEKPMGLAADRSRLAIGTAYQIWELRNVPAVTAKLDPPDKHDACYLPRRTHVTGDIDIHEMAYGQDELWFINTRFSCLCTLDPDHSFIPRWRPSWITGYDLGDRCHLNGLGMRDNQPRYATALGETNTPGGWRANKASGGLLIDIPTNQILSRGLSMPHSPRWYGGKLWVLESGKGSLATVDLQSGNLTTVAQLPGFTRGFDFWGPLAFIGLSQIRETAVFSGLPITERLQERICGVWVVNIQTGEIVAFLKFEEAVQEIFAISVLPGIRFPEIIDWDETLLGTSYVLPDQALKDYVPLKPEDLPPSSKDSSGQKRMAEKPETPGIDSFAVIIPVFNLQKKGEAVFLRTLRSIEVSIDFFRSHSTDAAQMDCEVVLVDDGSTDDTWDMITLFTKDQPYYRLVRHAESQGPAAARNTGVRACKGKALFFCDDDDVFLPEHILTALTTLNQPITSDLQPKVSAGQKVELGRTAISSDQSPTRQPILQLPGHYPAAVKTGVRLQDSVHPHWKKAIQTVLPLNLCIRREAHEFIEGFPEDQVFRLSNYALEDYAYNAWLTTFFSVLWHPLETVEHIRYPGNHFDQQLKKFQVAPGEYEEPISAKQKKYLDEIEQIVQTRRAYLQEKSQTCLDPEQALNLGNEAYFQRNLEVASRYYQQCLALNPDLLVARYNLGVVYLEQEQWQDAIAQLQQVIATDPTYAEAYNNLGIVHQHQHQLSQAIAYYRQAITCRFQFPDAHFNLGMALLQSGELPAGFAECEWRWQTENFTPFVCPQPQWDGSHLPEATILIHTEQGAGDAIQFIRYLPLVAQRCRRVLLVCTADLLPLLATVAGVDQLLTPGEIALSAFDVYAPLMSLPYIFGTTLDTIPAQVPYLTAKADPKWEAISTHASSLKVGIVWSGSLTHRQNHNRSCPLMHLLPILQIPGVSFYSLQKGERSQDLSQLPRDVSVQDLSPLLENFADTAGAIAQLDLVISVDTSVAHLTGALGKPVWTLLCHSPDWRWMLERSNCPWYPTMRLFRQPAPGAWAEVVDQVIEALGQLVQHQV